MRQSLKRQMRNEDFARYYEEYMQKYSDELAERTKDLKLFHLAVKVSEFFHSAWPILTLIGMMATLAPLVLFGIFAALFSRLALYWLLELRQSNKGAREYAERRMHESR